MSDISNIADRIGLPNHMKILLVDSAKPDNILDNFTVIVNPESYKVEYKNCYKNDQAQGDTESHYSLNKVKEQTMQISLIFDSTGSLGSVPFIGNHSVLDQIERFLQVVQYNTAKFGQDNEKKSLKLIWGPKQFFGVLTNLNINYSHFDTQGVPIRATAFASFSGGDLTFDMSEKAQKRFDKGKEIKKIDIGKQKHAINAVVKYGHYVTLIARQPEAGKPKSIRIAEEIARMII
ncbi:MAG: hypothetical protein IT222_11345 [Crocinitomix sp.]|nr:hypothetical protein [Crocinitomix sp.]